MHVEATKISQVNLSPQIAQDDLPLEKTIETTVRLFQIVYDEQSFLKVENGFELLDNRENKRPDWFEYWPIRNFLCTNTLDESTFYGFFSPKFGQKTGLSYAEVVNFVKRHAATADILLFSPQPDMGAFFLNVFEQGEAFDPGLVEAVNELLAVSGIPLDVKNLVMDSRQVVFSNYFVALPRFWREWLRVNEALYEICEGQASNLKDLLCRPTSYPGAAQRKVFIQERIASLLLTAWTHWRSVAYNPFNMAWSDSRLRNYPNHAYINDALKLAYRTNGHTQYMEAYAHMRDLYKSTSNVQTASSYTTHAEPKYRSRARRSSDLLSHFQSRIPIIVPTYNNPTYTRNMVRQLINLDVTDIIVIDNNSGSDEMDDLLRYLSDTVSVIRLDDNKGPHHVFLDDSVFEALPQVFCVTDPDLAFNLKMPSDFLSTLLYLTEKFAIGKAGLALDISDQEAMRLEKANHGGREYHIWEWEAQFWDKMIDTLSDGSDVYLADVDTTFALYNKKFFSRSNFYKSLRVAGNYTSIHLPWYQDNGMKSNEDSTYRATQKFSYYVR
jgi:hypothetical protein